MPLKLNMDTNVEKLKQMVGRCRVGMLGISHDDKVQFNPMSHVDIDDHGDLWFFTSNKMRQDIKHDSSVHLIYLHEPAGTYLYIDGVARVVNNKAKMKELFNPFIRTWFPNGLEDNNISLVAVHPVVVEYWVNESRVLAYNKIVRPDISEDKFS